VVGIRVLAGGALSGSTERHPIASPPPEPIGSLKALAAGVPAEPGARWLSHWS
jgi:L-galactose dehydrogenase/L-glyceraldehyde 3-phosphate reductase